MSTTETANPEAAARGEPPKLSFFDELAQCWRALTEKGLFFSLLALWVCLFHFLGNSTFGYIDTPSLFRWMLYSYRNSPDDELGMLIPFVVLGLFWWKRNELLALPAKRWWPAALLIALALILHVLGYVLQQTRISIVAFFTGLYAFIGFVWGPSWLKASLFPFFLFAFCVPLSTLADVITFPLRLVVTRAAVGIAHLIGIDVLRNGTQIFDSGKTFQFEVAAACSGIRSLVSLFALTTIYGFVSFRATWKRLLMMALALPLALVGNILRILAIIVAAEAFGQGAGLFMDRWFGFITFAFALGCVLFLGRWLAEDQRQEPGAGREREIARRPSVIRARPSWIYFVAVLSMIVLVAWSLAGWKKHQRLGPPGVKLSSDPLHDPSGNQVTKESISLPYQVLNYNSQPQAVTTTELAWLPKDTTFGRRLYQAPDGFLAMISAVLMGTDRTSIHKPEFCLYGQGWVIDSAEQITVPIQRPHPYDLPVMKLVTSRPAGGAQGQNQALRGLYLYWFVADNALTADHKKRMWSMARHLVTARELQRWAYITYFVVCYPGQEEETLERLKRFIAASVPEFQLAVPRSG